eukprot:NODE_4302_length_809_cov_131.302053_g4144_i0.p1 GENE.NODE_4302_length_809_cov_131.302053_g4144_i0~~NODE_4302_length_809_cov_131.302053_g4144_i0.p1  ORF type:complete len:228 (-),score=79.24 NODE_4302_length_809_cov_131.302053_g4144_i0:75-758(-)
MLRTAFPRTFRGCRAFFNDSFLDNCSLEAAYRFLVRTPEVKTKLLDFYCQGLDQPSLDNLAEHHANKTTVCVPLQPHLGDPHRVLLAYSFLEHVEHLDIDGAPIVETTIGLEHQRIKILDAQLIVFLAQKLLIALGKPSTPAAAKEYLDKMVEGADQLAAELLQKAPPVESPLEQSMREINEEGGGPWWTSKRLVTDPQSLDQLKYKTMPHPDTGKVEGKVKYFTGW